MNSSLSNSAATLVPVSACIGTTTPAATTLVLVSACIGTTMPAAATLVLVSACIGTTTPAAATLVLVSACIGTTTPAADLNGLRVNVNGVVKVKKPRYRPGCGPEGGRGIALLFQDLGARRG